MPPGLVIIRGGVDSKRASPTALLSCLCTFFACVSSLNKDMLWYRDELQGHTGEEV